MSYEEVWRGKTDEEVFAAAEKLEEYTPEGQQIILAEAQRRTSSDYLAVQADAERQQDDEEAAIQRGACPKCGRTNITRHSRWRFALVLGVAWIVAQSAGQDLASRFFPSGSGSEVYLAVFVTTLSVFLFGGTILTAVSAAAGKDKCKDCGRKWR